MKITPLYSSKININNAGRNPICKNQARPLSPTADVYFKGKSYPSGYYSDTEIEYAKKYLGVEDWEDKVESDEYDKIQKTKKEPSKIELAVNALLFCAPLFVEIAQDAKKAKKNAAELSLEIRKLMIDLNNEKLAQIQKEKRELAEKAKREERESKIKKSLLIKFVNPIQNENTGGVSIAPSAVLIEGSSKEERAKTIDWMKLQTDARNKSFTLPNDEDDALYRLEIEMQYAKEHYETSRQRTVMFIENFASILDSKKSSDQLIGDLKEIMSSLSKDRAPITIVFEVANSDDIDDAFMKNNVRIPLKINLDSMANENPVEANSKKTSMESYSDGLSRDWHTHLEGKYQNMPSWQLESEKYYLSQEVEQCIKNKDYEKVIKLKDKIALICDMQGKNRDSHLLRTDIEKYLGLM